jgi:hypothetical protein
MHFSHILKYEMLAVVYARKCETVSMLEVICNKKNTEMYHREGPKFSQAINCKPISILALQKHSAIHTCELKSCKLCL